MLFWQAVKCFHTGNRLGESVFAGRISRWVIYSPLLESSLLSPSPPILPPLFLLKQNYYLSSFSRYRDLLPQLKLETKVKALAWLDSRQARF